MTSTTPVNAAAAIDEKGLEALVAQLREPIWELGERGRMVPVTEIWRADMLAAADHIASLEAERDEATNWSDIVDRHGTDQFDELAELWLALPAIQRVTNAVVSTFAKWANDDLMARFRQHQLSMFHMAYVEGCLAGVKAAEARALSSSKGGK